MMQPNLIPTLDRSAARTLLGLQTAPHRDLFSPHRGYELYARRRSSALLSSGARRTNRRATVCSLTWPRSYLSCCPRRSPWHRSVAVRTGSVRAVLLHLVHHRSVALVPGPGLPYDCLLRLLLRFFSEWATSWQSGGVMLFSVILIFLIGFVTATISR